MAIVPEYSLRSIVRQIPDLVEVTVRNRVYGPANADTYGLGTKYDARRQPLTSGDVDGRARRVARWCVYAIRDQAPEARPVRLSKIVEADGTEWHVELVEWSFTNFRFLCDCIEALPKTPSV